MLEICHTEIFGLERALIASGNPKSIGKINTLDTEHLDKAFERCYKLGSAPGGSGHDHFLLGIHVQFDIKYPAYWTIEAERYHNFEIISSQSKMHKLTMMGKDKNFDTMFNQYVDDAIIDNVKKYINTYNSLIETSYEDESLPLSVYNIEGQSEKRFENKKEALYYLFMKTISNLPMGFEMWETCDLTYLQIKTMVQQRQNHKLKEDWGEFCDWAFSLDYFSELTGLVKK
jgi:hypothetical protein